MFNAFQVGVSYDIVTEDSAAEGDFAECGWEREHEGMTLREALATLQRYGPFDGVQRTWNGLALYQSDADIDYRTGEHTRYAVHVEGSQHNIARLIKCAGL